MAKPETNHDAGTAALGWAPVRQVPPSLTQTVAAAEAATMHWWRQRESASLYQAVTEWQGICHHPRFDTFDIDFRLDALNRCGIMFNFRAGQGRNGADLDTAGSYWHMALALLEPGSPERSRYLHNLGSLPLGQYSLNGRADQLDQAIALLEAAITDAAPTDHNLPLYHYSTAIAFKWRYERTGSLGDLETAIRHGEMALDLAPADSPRRTAFLGQQGNHYRQRFLRTKAASDLEQAIQLLEAAVQRASQLELPSCLSNLGNCLLERYNFSGKPEDLDHSISVHRQAIEATPSDHILLPARLNNLANSLSQKYAQNQSAADLDEAILRYRQAIELTKPPSHT
jgi:tetratricopeptide (TPR) repeat protein